MDTNFVSPPAPASTSKMKWAMVAVVAVVAIAASGWAILNSKGAGKVAGADTTYQAVFLTNGQVYFGKLADQGSWMQLTDIYYLQVTQNLQQAAGADAAKTATPSTTGTATPSQSNIQLVKLGSELHGPTDNMYIEKDKVLFWENMKDDSKVVQAIHQYQAK